MSWVIDVLCHGILLTRARLTCGENLTGELASGWDLVSVSLPPSLANGSCSDACVLRSHPDLPSTGGHDEAMVAITNSEWISRPLS
jgi:hypothetical protein